MLSDENRVKLDGIVSQMETNNESPENIQSVVNDFKSKYDVVIPQANTIARSQGNLQPQQFNPQQQTLGQKRVSNAVKTWQGALGELKSAAKTISEVPKLIETLYQSDKEKDQLRKLNPQQYYNSIITEAKTKGPAMRKAAAKMAIKAAYDIDRTFGFEGGKTWNIDTAINKWQNYPISAMTDLGTIFSLGQKAILSSADQAMLKKSILRSGDKVEHMREAANLPAESQFGRVLNNESAIKELLKKNPNSIKDPKYFEKQGKFLGDQIMSFSKQQANELDKALVPVKNNVIDKHNLAYQLQKTLNEEGLMEGSLVKEHFNNPYLKKVIEKLNDKYPMSMEDLLKQIRTIDDKINWISEKEMDTGLKITRKILDQELVNRAPKNFGEIKTDIHNRLDLLSKREKTFRNNPAQEKAYTSMFDSDNEVDAIKQYMKQQKDNKLANQIVDSIDSMKGWKEWQAYINKTYELPNFTRIYGLHIPLKTEGLASVLGQARMSTAGKVTEKAAKELAQKSLEAGSLIWYGLKKPETISGLSRIQRIKGDEQNAIKER